MVIKIRRGKTARTLEEAEELSDLDTGLFVSYTASLVSQGKHRFYTLAMPSDVLAETCVVDLRSKNPIDGFQRILDKRRAEEIKQYIDKGFGSIPTSIVLSAQASAGLSYTSAKRTLRFRKKGGSFLILDGQHRIYGFFLSDTRLRVPVVIYNNLSRADECKLFIDINTKQRPVPPELLLDIKKLAETENSSEADLREIFDLFDERADSPLAGLMSRAEKKVGKISRVTFNAALRPVSASFAGSDAVYVYDVLSCYLHACRAGLRKHKAQDKITNPILFRALMLLFPVIAERVSDRHPSEYTTANFDELIAPMFSRVKKADLDRIGSSYISLYDIFRKAMKSGFSIGSPD